MHRLATTAHRRLAPWLALAALGLAACGGRPAPLKEQADRILVEKAAHRLTLLRGGQPLRSYRVALGRNPIGDKVWEGDNRVPEGLFTIDRHVRPSRYHLALHISYPDSAHAARANEKGVSPGGDIMIHGMLNGFGWIGRFHRLADWTAGCIAVTDAEIEQIYAAVPDGTPIEIRP